MSRSVSRKKKCKKKIRRSKQGEPEFKHTCPKCLAMRDAYLHQLYVKIYGDAGPYPIDRSNPSGREKFQKNDEKKIVSTEGAEKQEQEPEPPVIIQQKSNYSQVESNAVADKSAQSDKPLMLSTGTITTTKPFKNVASVTKTPTADSKKVETVARNDNKNTATEVCAVCSKGLECKLSCRDENKELRDDPQVDNKDIKSQTTNSKAICLNECDKCKAQKPCLLKCEDLKTEEKKKDGRKKEKKYKKKTSYCKICKKPKKCEPECEFMITDKPEKSTRNVRDIPSKDYYRKQVYPAQLEPLYRKEEIILHIDTLRLGVTPKPGVRQFKDNLSIDATSLDQNSSFIKQEVKTYRVEETKPPKDLYIIDDCVNEDLARRMNNDIYSDTRYDICTQMALSKNIKKIKHKKG